MNIVARVLLLVPLLSAHVVAAAEPWADTKLPTEKGLELWFDATKQIAVRQARKLPVINDNSLVDVLLDGSGQQRDLTQRMADAQPKFKTAGASAFLRFDGKDDFLAVANLRRAFTNCTVFIVAAPKSNEGYFRGLLAFAATSQRDYTSGFNMDLGGTGTPNFSTVNVEGAGMNGQRNLRTTPGAFGRWQVLTVTSQPGTNGARLFVDGGGQGRRERNPGALRMDEFTLGARLYSNTPEPPSAQGFLDGDIAEVLVFSRVLPQAERQAVEKYLTEKHAPLHTLAAGPQPGGARPLELVANPPAVQMLVPGFTVRELPLELKNLTSIKYRADGKCYGVGYNGQIWLLSDTDGDGAPDKADLFFDGAGKLRGPIGLALTPPGYKHGEGVFVPSKGKLSLIVDKNGDDRADEEIIVATGWKEITQNVDAIGVALDKDGSIYFALGAANYANGYLLDADGKSQFDLKSERGTVLKVAPDFSKREVVCTGVRFPVAMAFNRHGDLFCSEQEGATWLPNGNPFDELLHIQPGRHYGFPPRHPKHLPNVFDEPSTFDYGPQHQSTCGLNFNEPVNGGKIFGPSHWVGDALVTGESRGKLYRTKLVKTAAGYVAQNHLIACLNYLTVDACLTPRGDLLVACHTGKPDWGTGPNGPGKLFLLRHTDTNAPQPVLTWSASPTEIRIAFDKALDPANLRDLARRTSITAGKYVMPGDRFEAMWPGYQVVKDQKATPRYDVPVLSASVTPDRRNIILHTAPRTAAVNYAVRMPNVSRSAGFQAGANQSNTQRAGSETGAPKAGLKPGANEKAEPDDDIELLVDNHGVEAMRSSGDTNTWTGWLPHLDIAVSKALTVGSAEHERLWAQQTNADHFANLHLVSKLNFDGMLQPSVQPGSKLDYQAEPQPHRIVLRGSLGSVFVNRTNRFNHIEVGRDVEVCTVDEWSSPAWRELIVSLGSPLQSQGQMQLSVHWSILTQPELARPFPLRRFYLPWAEPKAEPAPLATERVVPELAGGRWLAGRRLFHSEQLACAKCHRTRGEGSAVGPDLSNLLHRDYASVLRDIREPSAAINPDHPAFNVDLTDGESLTGVVVGESAAELRLADATGKTVILPRAKVKGLRASTLSLMPEGLLASLNAEQVRDLMTFLLTVPLEPAPIEGSTPPPPPRKRAEVEALLRAGGLHPPPAASSSSSASKLPEFAERRLQTAGTGASPLHIVLCAGPKDHGKGEHDYPLWQRRWSKLLPLADNVTVSTADKWPSAEQFAKANVICFFNNNPVWNEERGKELDAYLARGGGAAYFHWAVEARTNAMDFAKRIGLASDSSKLKYRHGPIDFVFHEHPLAKGFTATSFTREKFVDETYWNFQGDPKDVQLLASAPEDGKLTPQLWTRTVGKGRVFVAVPGHYNWTFDDPVFRVLALRGICWAAGQPEDRLVELSTIGARIAD
jgi:putative heme-binding domain-containing protein